MLDEKENVDIVKYFYGFVSEKIEIKKIKENSVFFPYCPDSKCAETLFDKLTQECMLKKELLFNEEINVNKDCIQYLLSNVLGKVFLVENDKSGYPCTVYFSNSPIVRYNKSLVFKNAPKLEISDFKEKINQYENPSAKEFKIENHITRKIVVNNVGQGNFIECVGNKSLISDIGFTIFAKDNNFQYSIEKIEKVSKDKSYDLVVISHLDCDHIIGVSYADDKIYNKKWIISCPCDEKGIVLSKSAQRLVFYLIKNYPNNIFLIKNNDDLKELKKCIVGKNILIERGNGDTSKCTKINSTGLILRIKQKHSKYALLPGDCTYNAIHIRKKKYKILVVPHHGYDMKGENSIKKFKPRNKNSIAIISVGKNNYSQPNSNHIEKLKKLGYTVKQTSDSNIKEIICKL